MQNKPIIYNSLSVAAKNGLDIEVTWNVGNHSGKLAGSGHLQEAMRMALDYNSKNPLSRPDVTQDLSELFNLAETENWNWESTRLAAMEKALKDAKASSIA